MELVHGGDWAGYRAEFGCDALDFSANVSPLGLPAGLRALGLRVMDGQANYLLFRATPDFGEKLRRRGAVVRSCANYLGLDAAWYRTAVRTAEENTRLLQIMGEILA